MTNYPLAERIRTAGGLRTISAASGISYTTLLYTIKDSDHEALKAFLEFCKVINCTPSEGAAALSMKDGRRDQLKALILRTFADINSLCETKLVNERYVFQLLNGISGNKVVRLYMPLCAALKISLEDFASQVLQENAA